MTPIQATINHGQIIPDVPVEWPDGMRVTVLPGDEGSKPEESEPIGLREDEWPTTPEGIAKLVEQISSFEPVEMTEDEEAELAQFRAEMKRKSIEAMKRSWEKSE
jgi:hypothetical protein